MKNKKQNQIILVTGGAGFIGSHLVDKLLEIGHKVVLVDDFNSYYNPEFKEENISRHIDKEYFKLYRYDISDFEALGTVFEKEKIDKIIHLAARAGVRASIQDPILYEKVDIGGTTNLLELARKHNIKDFIFASSSSVYGNQKKVPFSENNSADRPISPYGAAKRSTELLAYAYHHLFKINCTGLRFFTVYGERGRPDMAPYLFTESILKGKEIQKFGDGTTKRDYTYIDDIIRGILACLDKNFGYEIINLGNNRPISLNDFMRLLEKITGTGLKIKVLPEQPGDVKITCADISKAKKLLGWEPQVPLELGLKKFVSWFRNNRLR